MVGEHRGEVLRLAQDSRVGVKRRHDEVSGRSEEVGEGNAHDKRAGGDRLASALLPQVADEEGQRPDDGEGGRRDAQRTTVPLREGDAGLRHEVFPGARITLVARFTVANTSRCLAADSTIRSHMTVHKNTNRYSSRVRIIMV